jgi:hypothetical protein
LPYSSMKWALSQPPSVLGMWEAFNEMFQLGHSLGDEKYMIDTWPHLLARHVLTQELDDYILAVHEELKYAVDTRFGTDTENWATLDLLDTIRMVVNQVGSRFAVGLPLCKSIGVIGHITYVALLTVSRLRSRRGISEAPNVCN